VGAINNLERQRVDSKLIIKLKYLLKCFKKWDMRHHVLNKKIQWKWGAFVVQSILSGLVATAFVGVFFAISYFFYQDKTNLDENFIKSALRFTGGAFLFGLSVMSWKYTHTFVSKAFYLPDKELIQLQDNDIVMTVLDKTGSAFLSYCKTGLPVEIKIIDSGKSFDMQYRFKDAIQSGRILRIAKGESQIDCFSPEKLDSPFARIHYIFGDNAFIRWDPTLNRIIWGGFSAEAER